jgi:hypothetical protein
LRQGHLGAGFLFELANGLEQSVVLGL